MLHHIISVKLFRHNSRKTKYWPQMHHRWICLHCSKFTTCISGIWRTVFGTSMGTRFAAFELTFLGVHARANPFERLCSWNNPYRRLSPSRGADSGLMKKQPWLGASIICITIIWRSHQNSSYLIGPPILVDPFSNIL